MQYSVKDFKPFKEYYYIVNLINLKRPELYPVYFTNKPAALRALRQNVKVYGQLAKFEVMKGKAVEKLQLKYLLLLGKLQKATKYDYPKDCITRPQRHAFRKNMQRRLYRMGLFTNAKSKGRINEVAQYVKLKSYEPTEKQKKRFDRPNTEAKVIRLERKGKKNYYYIISHKPSNHRKILREVRALRFNGINGEYKELNLLIYKKDIIIPYLIGDFITMLKNSKYGKDCLDYFRAAYSEDFKGKQKDLLSKNTE